MSITSFDHFIETLEHVPAELQRNFNLMTDLDVRAGEVVQRINEVVKEYKKTNKRDERIALYKESMELFDKARAYADDKIDLANQTYDLVDKHIRNLECLSTPNTNEVNEGASGSSTDKKKGDKKPNNDQPANEASKPLAVDMPLDPNEPKYCTCQQVSFGEMIACDNKDCPIEWFHFACVELKEKPKGKWYCPECFNINKKGNKKFKKVKV